MLAPIFCLFLIFIATAAPDDDAHNHDGTHPEGQDNCGTNYMLPGQTARLGSHSFMILGQEDENHVIAEHRSGTPPHNYQFLLRVRLDPDEMGAYREILKDSRTLPAFTTIYFDKNIKQLDRSFFCLQDLPKIFGKEQKKGDAFAKLFPIRASLQKNPDHEGGFAIEKSVVPEKYFVLERADVELIVYRYLPSYLAQDALRKAIREQRETILPLLDDAPLFATESPDRAAKRKSYIATDGVIAEAGQTCPKNYYLKNTPVLKTLHSFILLAEIEKNTVLATHYYDQAPQNFQTVLKLKLSDQEAELFRRAKKESRTFPFLQTRFFFCMEELRSLLKAGKFNGSGTLYKDSALDDYRRGTEMGKVELEAKDVEVLVNRRLESLMNPLEVAADVAKAPESKKKAQSDY